MFDVLQKKLAHTEAYQNFLSVLHHSILLPCKYVNIEFAIPMSYVVKCVFVLCVFFL